MRAKDQVIFDCQRATASSGRANNWSCRTRQSAIGNRQSAMLLALATALACCFSLAAQQPTRPRLLVVEVPAAPVSASRRAATKARPSSQDPAFVSAVENSAALDNFFRALAGVQNGRRLERVRIMITAYNRFLRTD